MSAIEDAEVAVTVAATAQHVGASGGAGAAAAAAAASAEDTSMLRKFHTLQCDLARLDDSTLPAADEEYQRQVKASLLACLLLTKDVASNSVFSPNETLQEIHTEHIPYVFFSIARHVIWCLIRL